MIDKKINNHRNKIICPYLKITSSLYLSKKKTRERERHRNVPGGRDNTSLLAFSSSSTTRVYKYREVRTLNLVFLVFSFLILINLASFLRAIFKKLRRVFTCLGCCCCVRVRVSVSLRWCGYDESYDDDWVCWERYGVEGVDKSSTRRRRASRVTIAERISKRTKVYDEFKSWLYNYNTLWMWEREESSKTSHKNLPLCVWLMCDYGVLIKNSVIQSATSKVYNIWIVYVLWISHIDIKIEKSRQALSSSCVCVKCELWSKNLPLCMCVIGVWLIIEYWLMIKNSVSAARNLESIVDSR